MVVSYSRPEISNKDSCPEHETTMPSQNISQKNEDMGYTAGKTQQCRQFAYSVILWHVPVTTAAMESQQWVMCVLLRYIYDECMSPATIKPNRFSCKVSDIFADFDRIRNFATDFHIRLQIKTFIGIRRVGTAMSMMEVQTEHRGEANSHS
jgi:hypothetical protein